MFESELDFHIGIWCCRKKENMGRQKLKGLAMILAGQENPFIIFRSKKIYIYFKTNNKIPMNLMK